MKIGVSSYSFFRYYKEGKINDLTFPAKAKEMGFEAIEYAGLTVPEGENEIEWAKKVRSACDEAGFQVSNFTIGADFINGSNGDFDAEVERVKHQVDLAEIIGATGMRHDATFGFLPEHKGPRTFDYALPTVVKGCRAITEYAATKNIRTMVENHGFFSQNAERVEKIMAGVNHPNFGWLVDMGNFACADEDSGYALGIAMQYAFHVHAKDFHKKDGSMPNPGEGWFRSRGGNYLRGAIIGHGDIPIVRCLEIMKRAGYDGVFSIEFEGMEDNERALSIGLANLKRFVKQVYEA